MKRTLLLVMGILVVLVGCQKKESKDPRAAYYASLSSRQTLLSKIQKGMSVSEVRAASGHHLGGSGGGGMYDGAVQASDGGLVLYFENDRLGTIISSPKASGSLTENKAKIRVGMSREEILTRIGFPDMDNKSPETERATYFLNDGALDISLVQGSVTEVTERPGAKNDIGSNDLR